MMRAPPSRSGCMFVASFISSEEEEEEEEDQQKKNKKKKKLGIKGAGGAALIMVTTGMAACCLIAFTLCTSSLVLLFNPINTLIIGRLRPASFPAAAVLIPSPPPPPPPPPAAAAVNLVQSIASSSAGADGLKLVKNTQEIISRPPNQSFGLELEEDDDYAQSSRRRVGMPPALGIHNFSSSRSQVYELKGDIRIHGNSSTIFVISSSSTSSSRGRSSSSSSWITKPYARSIDKLAMRKVSGFKIQIINNSNKDVDDNATNCNFIGLPAIVFSTGGYSGNPFHDFTDVLIPLYLTSRRFNSRVVFLVADMRSWWTAKYRLILEKLSGHDIVDIHAANAASSSDHDEVIMCFRRVIVGLRAHRELSIDPSKPPYYSLRDFTKFLRTTYSLERHRVQQQQLDHSPRPRPRPRLLIISRKKTRRLTNAREVAALGRRLGFDDVVVSEMGWEVSRVAALVNSFDVMVGVHGAGLTNMVFLPENAVVIQIVPIGVEMLAKQYFQEPAKDMGLRYMEYRVSLNESSLSSSKTQFAANNISSSSSSSSEGGWHSFRSVYLDAQDIKLHLPTFKETLSNALNLVLLH